MNTIYNPEVQRDELICPITLQVFQDPVIAKDGHAYEYLAITQWIFENGTSPLTREPLEIEDLVPAIHLKRLAAQRRTSTISNNVRNDSTIALPSIEQTPKNDETNRNRTPRCYNRTWIAIIVSILSFTALIVGIVLIIKSNQSKESDSISSDVIYTTYSSSLNTDSPTFYPVYGSDRYFYYKKIPLVVLMNGDYEFNISSDDQAAAYFYSNDFDSLQPYRNLIADYNNPEDQSPCKLTVYLQTNETYYLVVTSADIGWMRFFSIIVYGPSQVNFISTQTSTFTSTSSYLAFSTYSSWLTFDSPVFKRPNAIDTGYYYQVSRLFIPTNGFYTVNGSGSVLPYGFIYSNQFNPSLPYTNLIISNKKSTFSGQFYIGVYLFAGSTYFLVITTSYSGSTGLFSVNACGPGQISFLDRTMTMTTTTTTTTMWTDPYNTFQAPT